MPNQSSLRQIKARYGALGTLMDERMRRQWAATEAQTYGWGGLSAVSAAHRRRAGKPPQPAFAGYSGRECGDRSAESFVRALARIAESFFEATRKAAVSAKALSLRRISRSSSWMRRRSLRVSSGRARASAGVANAAIA